MRKSKRSNYQNGGSVERSSTYIQPPLLQGLDTLQLKMDQYPMDMLKLANNDPEILKSYYRMVHGAPMKGTSNKVKSKVRRYREQQSGGTLNPLDPNSYGKKYKSTESKQPVNKYSLTVTPSDVVSKYTLTTTDSYGGLKTRPAEKSQNSGATKLTPKLKSNVNETLPGILKTVAVASGEISPEAITTGEQILKKLSDFSHNRPNGVMTPEERTYRESLAEKGMPFGYDVNAHQQFWKGAENASLPTGMLEDDNNILRKKYFKTYLGIDTAEVSNYNPKMAKPLGTKDIPYDKKEIYNIYARQYHPGTWNALGKSKANIVTRTSRKSLSHLGDFTIGRGTDEKGDYISVYDKWDLHPGEAYNFLEKINIAPDINNLNFPFEIYDRIYLNELSSSERDTVHMVDKKLGVVPVNKKNFKSGGDIVSQLGYRDDSPFRDAPQLTINSPSISMENVSTPLIGISNQTGETKLMKPNKKYKFKNTSSVTEMPAYQKGGNIGNILAALAPAASAIPGPWGLAAGAALSLAPTVAQLFAKPDDTVVSGSPGMYQTGGRLDNSIIQSQLIEQGLVRDTDLSAISDRFERGEGFAGQLVGKRLQPLYDPESGKVVIRNPRTGLYNLYQNSIQSKNSGKFAKYELQAGGDIPLSSQAFQVQGNPNVIDGNAYPELNANLDHNEVVTNTTQGSKFVFSDDLKEPTTNKSFAELAAKQEKAKGKAEKILKSSPYDEQAKSTISMSNANLNHISNLQEAIANALGHRNPDGSTRQNYQKGGSIPPKASDFVWDPIQNKYVSREDNMQDIRGMVMNPLNSFLGTVTQNNIPEVPGIPDTYQATPQTIPQANVPQNTTSTVSSSPKKSTKQSNLPYSGFNVGDFQKWYNQYRQGITVPTTALAEDAKWGPKTAKAWSQFGSAYSDPNSPTAREVRDIYRTNMPFLTIPETRQSLSSTHISPLSTTVGPGGIAPQLPKGSRIGESAMTTPTQAEYRTPWTIGDYFKLAELGGKSIGAFGKPEVEPQLLDRTQYTQRTFDPTQSLYRNQRSYQNAINALSATTPVNLRRSLAGSALSSRYAADNQVLSQYDMMNQQARSQYEQQIGQQAQFNVQSQFRTNEINAANRAAQDAVQQNLFTSLGQFGEDLNRKRYAADIINLYRNQAPDVFDTYIKAMQRNGQ